MFRLERFVKYLRSTFPYGGHLGAAVVYLSALAFAANPTIEPYLAHLWYTDQTNAGYVAETTQPLLKVKPAPIFARGLYMTAYTASNERLREPLIERALRSGLNSLVIDIKDFSGFVLYESNLDAVKELETAKPVLGNLSELVSYLKRRGLYVIARQTVFQDPTLAAAQPAWAIRTRNGSVWRDNKGLAWVDPTREEVWAYNVAIAREAIEHGVDEINFDYVRFPSDGKVGDAVYSTTIASKVEVMSDFFSYIHMSLGREPAYVSADFFGLVTESGEFDLNIGQTLSAALNKVDYIYPMMYPSHYPAGHLGFANPAKRPYEVIQRGLQKAEDSVQHSVTRLRPWLQAFHMGARYDSAMISDQIRAAEESPISAGWMVWNAANRYHDLPVIVP